MNNISHNMNTVLGLIIYNFIYIADEFIIFEIISIYFIYSVSILYAYIF